MTIPPFDVDAGPKYDNPFDTVKAYEELGFSDIKLHWFHYHPAMPYLKKNDPKQFRKSSLELEKNNDWRGMFLASTFIIEATK